MTVGQDLYTANFSFYRPSHSPPASMLSKDTSIGLAFDKTINDVTVVGDFSLDA